MQKVHQIDVILQILTIFHSFVLSEYLSNWQNDCELPYCELLHKSDARDVTLEQKVNFVVINGDWGE